MTQTETPVYSTVAGEFADGLWFCLMMFVAWSARLQVTVVCLAEPGWYRGLHSFVQNATGGGGRLEVSCLPLLDARISEHGGCTTLTCNLLSLPLYELIYPSHSWLCITSTVLLTLQSSAISVWSDLSSLLSCQCVPAVDILRSSIGSASRSCL